MRKKNELSEQYINALDFSQKSTFRHGQSERRTIKARGEVQGNYRAREESLRRRILLCPIVGTRENERIRNIVRLQARLHTCTIGDTLFKYLVMYGRALA